MSRQIALVGGGHAHIEFVRRWRRAPLEDSVLTVFDPNPKPVYSGMVPGFVAGQYTRDEVEIDLAHLCGSAGALYVERRVERLDPEARRIITEGGREYDFEVASLDIGSTVVGLDAPGVREFALPSRPIAHMIERIDTLIDRLRGDFDPTAAFHVVGGGAAGVELAFCLDARLRATIESACLVEIITAEPRVLTGARRAARRRVDRALARRRILTRTGSVVANVQADAIELEAGQRLASAGALWVTGPAAHPLARASGLPTDDDGFVRIRPTLQVEGFDQLFAVGDCASLPGLTKAGVYAVRSGPLIEANVRARLQGAPLRNYSPQRDFLSLLNLGNGGAIGTKWGVACEGRSLMWLKDRIDRRFMERYR